MPSHMSAQKAISSAAQTQLHFCRVTKPVSLISVHKYGSCHACELS